MIINFLIIEVFSFVNDPMLMIVEGIKVYMINLMLDFVSLFLIFLTPKSFLNKKILSKLFKYILSKKKKLFKYWHLFHFEVFVNFSLTILPSDIVWEYVSKRFWLFSIGKLSSSVRDHKTWRNFFFNWTEFYIDIILQL